MKKIFSFLTAILFVGSMWATTYQHVFNAKPSTGNNVTLSGVSWTISATNLGSYNSGNYAGVQFGTSTKAGEISLTSSSAWGSDSYSATYKGKTRITEVRIWLNKGGGTVTPSVTIGGKSATSDGTSVEKNSKAGTDWSKATKVTFTPANDGKEGVVVVSVSSTNAGYICCLEIDCEEASDDPAVSFVGSDSKAISSYELAAAGEDDAWALVYSNIKADSEGATPDVAVYSNAECTTEFTGGWFEAVADGANSVLYSADANETGSTRTVYVVFSNSAKNASDGDVNLTDTLTVSQSSLVLVESVSVKAATELEVGETETLTVTVLPEGASDKTVTWESDKESVATVDENGKVTAVAPGKANITATANDGSGKSATCVVTVIEALEKSTLTFTDTYGSGGATADDGVVWTVESDGSESNYDATKGIHYGTSSGQVTYIQLSTSDITGTIKKVIVNASTANDVSATVSVKVGGNAFGGDAQDLTNSATNYTFSGSAKGTIVVLITKPEKAAKAIYCKSIVVKYDDTTTAIDNTEASVKAVKVLREGQIFILRGEKVYTVQGQLVK